MSARVGQVYNLPSNLVSAVVATSDGRSYLVSQEQPLLVDLKDRDLIEAAEALGLEAGLTRPLDVPEQPEEAPEQSEEETAEGEETSNGETSDDGEPAPTLDSEGTD